APPRRRTPRGSRRRSGPWARSTTSARRECPAPSRSGCRSSRTSGPGNRAVSWEPRAVFAHEDTLAVLAVDRGEVVVRVVRQVARRAVADLEIERVARGTIDQVVAVLLAGREAGAAARRQGLLAGVGDQHQLALDDPDELVLQGVPVAQ